MNDAPAQWDATTARLVAFAQRARYDALSSKTVHETKRRVIDTFASALGAYAEPVSVMARAVASRYRSDSAARVWGSGIATAPELAAFANGVMARSLDVSDTYLGKSRGQFAVHIGFPLGHGHSKGDIQAQGSRAASGCGAKQRGVTGMPEDARLGDGLLGPVINRHQDDVRRRRFAASQHKTQVVCFQF